MKTLLFVRLEFKIFTAAKENFKQTKIQCFHVCSIRITNDSGKKIPPSPRRGSYTTFINIKLQLLKTKPTYVSHCFRWPAIVYIDKQTLNAFENNAPTLTCPSGWEPSGRLITQGPAKNTEVVARKHRKNEQIKTQDKSHDGIKEKGYHFCFLVHSRGHRGACRWILSTAGGTRYVVPYTNENPSPCERER